MPFKVQTWENSGYTGRSQIFYTPGGFMTSFVARSYHWEPGPYNGKLRCSLAVCFNSNKAGWWGVSERYWPGDSENATAGIIYTHIACGEKFEDPGCPTPAEAATYTVVPVIETTSINPTLIVPEPTSAPTTSSKRR